MNSQQRSVVEWIDANQEKVIVFLQEMLRIPSVNPWFVKDAALTQEKEVQEFIARRMEELGADVEMWEPNAAALSQYEGMPSYVADRSFIGRPNLAATLKGSGEGKSLLLFGHIDTVKAGSGWTKDPYGGEISEGSIYGRGAVDMKGGVAAMIMALEAIKEAGVKLSGDVTVGTVVEEETSGMGALAFADRGYRADAAIVTEATNLKVAPLCRGILWGKITLQGRSGHIELPQGDWRAGEAVDAIEKARYVLDQIDRLNQDWALRKRHPLLAIPCQMRVGQVIAGEFPSTFANRAEIYFDAQFLPSERDKVGGGGLVQEEIETFIREISRIDPWLKEHPPTVEWLVNADCGEIAADHDFVKACQQALTSMGEPPILEGCYFHTDMGWLERVGIPSLNFGPGNPADAHQNDESVPIDELIKATKMIALTVMDWCGTAKS